MHLSKRNHFTCRCDCLFNCGKIKTKLKFMWFMRNIVSSLIDLNLNWTANRKNSNNHWSLYAVRNQLQIFRQWHCTIQIMKLNFSRNEILSRKIVRFSRHMDQDKDQIMKINETIKFCDASAVKKTECGISINVLINTYHQKMILFIMVIRRRLLTNFRGMQAFSMKLWIHEINWIWKVCIVLDNIAWRMLTLKSTVWTFVQTNLSYVYRSYRNEIDNIFLAFSSLRDGLMLQLLSLSYAVCLHQYRSQFYANFFTSM